MLTTSVRGPSLTPTSTHSIIPGGCSVPILPKGDCEKALYVWLFFAFATLLRSRPDPFFSFFVTLWSSSMDFDSLKDFGSGLGTGAVIVMDKSTDVINMIARFSKVSKRPLPVGLASFLLTNFYLTLSSSSTSTSRAANVLPAERERRGCPT